MTTNPHTDRTVDDLFAAAGRERHALDALDTAVAELKAAAAAKVQLARRPAHVLRARFDNTHQDESR